MWSHVSYYFYLALSFLSLLYLSSISLTLSFPLSLSPVATVTSSSENEERCGSSLEWGKDSSGGAAVRDSSHHAPPLSASGPTMDPTVGSDTQPKSVPAAGPSPASSPSDGPAPYHSTSLVMPRPNSVAGQSAFTLLIFYIFKYHIDPRGNYLSTLLVSSLRHC